MATLVAQKREPLLIENDVAFQQASFNTLPAIFGTYTTTRLRYTQKIENSIKLRAAANIWSPQTISIASPTAKAVEGTRR